MQICLTGAVLRLEGPATTPCLAARCRIDLDTSPPRSDRRGQSVTIDLPPTRVSIDHHHERRHSDCLSPPPRHGPLLTLHRSQKRPELGCQPETETKPGITTDTGKSHFTEALGQTAVEAGLTVSWFTIEDLGVLVRRHRADDSIARALAKIIRSDLIIADDIGLLPVSPDAAEGFYRLVDAAYERRSVAVSSNLHPSGFDEIMPKTLATATVDRLMHHAHIVVTQGDSYRLTQATSGQGVKPFS
jgi:hypothetical protein